MIKLSRGWQDMTLRTTAAWHLFLQIEFYWMIVCPHFYNLSMIGFVLQWQSWLVMMHSVWSTKPKVFTIWPFKWSEVKVTQSCLTLWGPTEYIVHGILQASILEWVAFPFSRDLSNPGTKPRSPALQKGSLPTELSGKPHGPLKKTFFFQVGDAQGLLACCMDPGMASKIVGHDWVTELKENI